MRPVVVNPNQKLRAKYDRVVEIITASPGISAGAIAKQYYGEKLTSQQRNLMISTLTQLCHAKRIEHESIDKYFVPE